MLKEELIEKINSILNENGCRTIETETCEDCAETVLKIKDLLFICER